MNDDADAYFVQRQRKLKRWAIVGLVITVLGVAIGIVLATCVSTNMVKVGDQRALETLQAAGYHDALLGGADALACSENESSRHFTATNAAGDRIEGTVCCGLTGAGKGCTLRFGRH